MKTSTPGHTALMALLVLFFVAGCSHIIDLPLTGQISQDDEIPLREQQEAITTTTEGKQLFEPIADTRPVPRKEFHIVQRKIDSSPLRPASVGGQAIGPAPDDAINTEPLSGMLQDTLALAVSDFQRAEKLNSSDRDNPSLAVSEIILFLLVGTVFVLVHISRGRPIKSSPDPRLSKFLHTRPWR
ncbi:MAG TPA: hypothetical protein VGJ57_03215 [Nitrospirales bacterium]|jgi:hypothetical protein